MKKCANFAIYEKQFFISNQKFTFFYLKLVLVRITMLNFISIQDLTYLWHYLKLILIPLSVAA